MICPFCHFNIGDNAELCPYCRISFNKEDIAKIKDSTKFVCPNCGGHKIYYAKGVNYLSSFYNSRDIKYIEPLCAECHTKARLYVKPVKPLYTPTRMDSKSKPVDATAGCLVVFVVMVLIFAILFIICEIFLSW